VYGKGGHRGIAEKGVEISTLEGRKEFEKNRNWEQNGIFGKGFSEGIVLWEYSFSSSFPV